MLVNKSGHDCAALNVQLLSPDRKEARHRQGVKILADTCMILFTFCSEQEMEMQSHTYTRTTTAPIKIPASLGDVPSYKWNQCQYNIT